MNEIQLIDTVPSEEHIAHYGVKGMKWGVWNAQTRAKYSGGLGKASNTLKRKVSTARVYASSGAKAVTRFTKKSMTSAVRKVNSMSANSVAKRTAKVESKKAIKAQRKELGMSPKKYYKLRKRTLKSHDPRVVEKGMYTLTDAELDTKINRLRKEETISKMATDLSTRKFNARKARSEAIKASPAYQIGKGYLDSYVNKKIKQYTKSSNKKDNGSNKKGNGSNKKDNGSNGQNQSATQQTSPLSQFSAASIQQILESMRTKKKAT